MANVKGELNIAVERYARAMDIYAQLPMTLHGHARGCGEDYALCLAAAGRTGEVEPLLHRIYAGREEDERMLQIRGEIERLLERQRASHPTGNKSGETSAG